MKQITLLLLVLWAMVPGEAPGMAASLAIPGRARMPETSLENARRAEAMLGPQTWTRLIRVKNTAARSAYPAVVYALVFEEAGILWFYTDTDGTQSFSLHPERLTEEQADFAPLLRAIEPGFATYAVLPSDGDRASGSLAENGAGGPVPGASRALPNGCFIESLAALAERVRHGEPIARARLLNCYVDSPVGPRGHTVLTYETPRGLFLLDPGRSPEPRAMPPAWADNAMALARSALLGAQVVRARWVPTELPAPLQLAALEPADETVPGAAPRLMR